MNLSEHPTVKRYQQRKHDLASPAADQPLDVEWVRQVVLDAGADDAGVASIDSPVLAEYREKFLTIWPEARTCISVVCRMNPDNIQSPYRQQWEMEYHHMFNNVDHVARRAAVAFMNHGLRAMDCGSSYPMNMENFPNMSMWFIHHKPIAVAAGRGVMGVHHLVVHEKYGAKVALASILLNREVTKYDQPLDYDPCCKCMLCVTVCPTGAINADGHINAMACYTHSYRDKYGGFVDWVENIIQSRNTTEYRRKHSDAETVLMWQSLSVGTSYKCTNCMAVCPGGDDHIGPYADDQKVYREQVAKRMQDRKETVYIVKGSDAESHVQKRFPNKRIQYVHHCTRPTSAENFLKNLPLAFQREQSKGLNATYHVTFTGAEQVDGTIVIKDKTITVLEGHQGTSDLKLTADTTTWLEVLRGERNIMLAMLLGKIKVRGPQQLLKQFAACFPA